ncbi:beta-ketoacyl reductase, partial [Frankia sp. AiPs1]|uniref:beta-ketoacyl reductase n=1 Tax=Frankia sp. AiPs1 TaxID=573493 RepID=UPI0020443688
DGARRVVLASRRGPDSPGARELLDELAALGTHATIDACDVADPDRLADLLRELADAGEPVTAVVHAAGTAGPTMPLARLTLAEFEEVVAGKVAGAGALDRLLDGPDGAKVAAFVLLSSISGVWGSGNQAAYSAANAYLDALAGRRNAEGRPATAVAFGPWDGSGIGAAPALRDYLTRRGLRPLDPEPAVTALTRAVAAGETTVTVVDVDWDRFLPVITAARPNHLFDDLPGRTTANPAGGDAETMDADSGAGDAVEAVDYGALPAARRASALFELVRGETAAILGHDDPDDIDPNRRFLELGFDSLASVQLSRRLAVAVGVPLGPPVVFEHPTVTELADHLDRLATAAGPGRRSAAGGAGGLD